MGDFTGLVSIAGPSGPSQEPAEFDPNRPFQGMVSIADEKAAARAALEERKRRMAAMGALPTEAVNPEGSVKGQEATLRDALAVPAEELAGGAGNVLAWAARLGRRVGFAPSDEAGQQLEALQSASDSLRADAHERMQKQLATGPATAPAAALRAAAVTGEQLLPMLALRVPGATALRAAGEALPGAAGAVVPRAVSAAENALLSSATGGDPLTGAVLGGALHAPAAAVAEDAAPAVAKKLSDQMSADELRQALLTSERVQLPNRRALLEAQQTAPRPVLVMSDVDGLKHINDTFGHDVGDRLLQAKAEALSAAGVDAYHLGGDEFASRFGTPEEAAAAMARVKQELAARALELPSPNGDGSTIRVEGIGFSHGIGNDLSSADSALASAKASRRAAGEAASRGEAPTYLAGGYAGDRLSRGLEGAAGVVQDPAAPPAGPARTAGQVGGRYPPGQLGESFSTKGVTNVAGMRDELAQLATEHADLIDRARGGRQPVSQYHDTQQLAQDLGLSVDDFLKTPAGTALGSRELALGRSLMGGLRDRVKELADGIAGGNIPEDAQLAAKDQIAKTQTDLVRLMATLHGKGFAEAGRTLRSAQEEVGSLASDPREEVQLGLLKRYRDLVHGPNGDEFVQRIAALDPSRPDDVISFLRQAEKPNFNDNLLSYWKGSLLSGPRTLERKGIGDVVKLTTDTAMRPFAALVDRAGLASAAGRAPAHELGEVTPALVGLYRGLPKGIAKFAQVVKNGYDPALLLERLKEGGDARLPIETFQLSDKPTVRRVGGALAMPSRLLSGTTAMMQTIADSSERYAWATRKAIQEGASDVPARAADLLQQQPVEMVASAKAAAQKSTYTDPMSPLGQHLARLRNLPGAWGKFFSYTLPFMHISDRVAAGVTDFLPGAKPFKLASLIKSGSPEAADLIARQTTGAALTLGALALAHTGRLVGAAPVEKKAKDDFYAEGKQPYSVLVGGHWMPIRDALGPLAGPFVAAIAIHDGLSDASGHGLPQAQAAFNAGLGAGGNVARYMLDASYLQSVKDIFDAVEEHGTKLGQGLSTAAARVATGFVPYSGLLRGAAVAADPRVVRRDTALDEIKSNLPGLRNTLDARIDPSGKPVMASTGRAGGLVVAVPTQSHIADPQLEEQALRAGTALRNTSSELKGLSARMKDAMQSRQFDRARELVQAHPEYRFAGALNTSVQQLDALEQQLRQLRASPLPPQQKAAIEIQLQRQMVDLSQRSLSVLGRAQHQ